MSTQLQLTNISISVAISTLPEIGTPCDADDRCNGFIPNGVCRNRVCACATGYTPNFANATCLQGEEKMVCVLNGDVGL